MQKYVTRELRKEEDGRTTSSSWEIVYLAAEADAEIAKLKEALREYGTHRVVCRLELGTGECDCGFDELQRSL